MWPFRKRDPETTPKTPPSTLRGDSPRAQIRELELRLLDLEGDFDKVLTQLKRFGARLAKRDEREPAPAQENGAEVVSLPSDPPVPPVAPASFDRKSALRARVRELRISR